MCKLYLLHGFFKRLFAITLSVFFYLVIGESVAFAQTEDMSSTDQSSNANGVPKSPTFQEADKNQDHYVTKDELEGYPILLHKFDSVDAGKDGKLEIHEYRNLVLEKRREKY